MPRLPRLALTALCLLLGAAAPGQMRILLGNPNANLLVGLVGYWPCTEASGATCADQSGQGNTLTLVNAPSRVAAPSGVYGQSLNLNGTNQYAVTSSTVAFSANVTACARITRTATGSFNNIIEHSTGVSTGDYTLYVPTSNKLTVDIPYVLGAVVVGATTIVTNTPYLACMTRSGSTGSWVYKVYLNGVQDGSASTTSNPTATAFDEFIGAVSQPAFYFQGQEGAAHVWARTLSAAEMAQFYTCRC